MFTTYFFLQSRRTVTTIVSDKSTLSSPSHSGLLYNLSSNIMAKLATQVLKLMLTVIRDIWNCCQWAYRFFVPRHSTEVLNARDCLQSLCGTLPLELVTQIYDHLSPLSPKDVVRLSLVSRKFRSRLLEEALVTVHQCATTRDEVSYLTVRELANRKHIVCSICKVLHRRLPQYERSTIQNRYAWPVKRECSEAAGYFKTGCTHFRFGKEAVELMLRARHMGKACGMPIASLEHSCVKVIYTVAKAEGEYLLLAVFPNLHTTLVTQYVTMLTFVVLFSVKAAIWMASDHCKLADPSKVSTKAFGARLLLRLSFQTTIDLRVDVKSQLDAASLEWCPHSWRRGTDRYECALHHAFVRQAPCIKCSGMQICPLCETDFTVRVTREAGENFATLVLTAWADLGGRGAHTQDAWSRSMDRFYNHRLHRSDRFFERKLDVVFEEALMQDHEWKMAINHARTVGRKRGLRTQESELAGGLIPYRGGY